MPDSVARFTISVPPELLATFDEVCASKGYVSRSEAVRDALRDYLVAHDWSNGEAPGEVVGTVTLVYDQDVRRLTDELRERQHRYQQQVLSAMHVHLDAASCLEVIVVKGDRQQVAALADELISLRGVKHGRLVCTTAGSALP
jgi:CopG family transcriptional regulator, nickel-responsive regulator